MAKGDKSTGLLSVGVILGLLLAFLTSEIINLQGTVPLFDSSVENFLFSVRTPFWLQAYGLITILGSTLTIIGLTIILSLRLFFSEKNHVYVAGLITTLAGAAVTGYLMKIFVARARPGVSIPSFVESSFSFPSGHATASMAFYGFLMYMLCTAFPAKRLPIVLVGVFLIGAIGFSRLYLGVHFPSDVLAGYLLGSLWLIIGVYITNRTREKTNSTISS